MSQYNTNNQRELVTNYVCHTSIDSKTYLRTKSYIIVCIMTIDTFNQYFASLRFFFSFFMFFMFFILNFTCIGLCTVWFFCCIWWKKCQQLSNSTTITTIIRIIQLNLTKELRIDQISISNRFWNRRSACIIEHIGLDGNDFV